MEQIFVQCERSDTFVQGHDTIYVPVLTSDEKLVIVSYFLPALR